MPRGMGVGGGGARKANRRYGVLEEDEEAVPADPVAARRVLLWFVVETAAILGLWVWSCSGTADGFQESIRDGNIRTTVFDVVVVLIARSTICSPILLTHLSASGYGWLATFILKLTAAVPATLLVSKLVIFKWRAVGGLLLTVGAVGSIATSIGVSRAVGGGRRFKRPRFPVLVKILRPYMVPRGLLNKLRAAMTWVCIVGAKVCNIFSPLILGSIVGDLYNSEVKYSKIATYCGIALLSKVLKEAQTIIYVRVKQTAYIQMAEMTFRHIHSLSLEWHLQKKMGNVLRSMDRGTQAADTVVSYLFLYLVPTLLEACVTFGIFFVHFNQPDLAGMCLLCFMLYLQFTFVVTAWRKKFREGMNKHDNEYHDKATDSLINFETVKYFSAEESECKSFLSSVASYQQLSVVTQATLSVLNSAQQAIIYSCLLGCMAIAGRAVVNGELKVSGFVAIHAYVLQLFQPLSFLGSIYNTVIMAFVNMQNLADLLNEVPDIVDAPNAVPLALPYAIPVPVEFSGVSFRYPSQDAGEGLRDISFKVGAGEKVAIVGPTGSGKTTLSRLLFRFYDVDAGEILVNGQDVAQVQQTTLRNAIGIVPQDTVMFNESILYNIQYGNPSATFDEIAIAARDAQLLEFIDKLPNGWDTKVGERGLRLSGGEKQRIAIARCLLKNPPIIVLDEATSSLDVKTEAEVLQALDKLGGGKTVIVIAHRLTTIRDADRIVVLKDGRVAESGTHSELRDMHGVYDTLWRRQEKEGQTELEDPPLSTDPAIQ